MGGLRQLLAAQWPSPKLLRKPVPERCLFLLLSPGTQHMSPCPPFGPPCGFLCVVGWPRPAGSAPRRGAPGGRFGCLAQISCAPLGLAQSTNHCFSVLSKPEKGNPRGYKEGKFFLKGCLRAGFRGPQRSARRGWQRRGRKGGSGTGGGRAAAGRRTNTGRSRPADPGDSRPGQARTSRQGNRF